MMINNKNGDCPRKNGRKMGTVPNFSVESGLSPATKQSRNNLSKMARSFTLLELLVVIAIIAILSGILLPAAMQAWSRAYVEKAKAAVSALEVAINMYKTDIGYYPDSGDAWVDSALLVTALTTDQGGSWHGPYMPFKEDEIVSGNFVDPWGNSYRYRKTGVKNPNSYDLYSYGPDGPTGDSDDDITNW